jgi:hypothetical protein
LDPHFKGHPVENRDKIMIENVSKNNKQNTNLTYAEAVTWKDKQVRFNLDKQQNNDSNTNTE